MNAVDWKVVAIFDEGLDGPTGFAYTKGLARHGLPELHIWARATEGPDVGAGFVLSPQDMAVVLNRIGTRLRAGELVAGSTDRQGMDGGLTAMVLELAGPVRAADVDACALRPEQSVLTCRWRLERPAPQSVDAAAVAAAAAAAISRACGTGPLRAEAAAEDGAFHDVIAHLPSAARRQLPHRLLVAADAMPEAGSLAGLAATLARTGRHEAAFARVLLSAHVDSWMICRSHSCTEESVAVESLLGALYGLWVVADLVLLEGAEERWHDAGAQERSDVARGFDAVVQAAVLAEWAGSVISAHEAVLRIPPPAGGADELGRRWRALDWRSVDLGHDVIAAVARSGHGWLDDERALAQLRAAGGAAENAAALTARSFQAAAVVAEAEQLPGIDHRRVARVLRRLASTRRPAA